MKRLRVGRESTLLLVSCLVALMAAVGCGSDSSGGKNDSNVQDPNAMQPGNFNPGGNIGGAGMGSTVPGNNGLGTGGSGIVGMGTGGTSGNNGGPIISSGSTKLPCDVSKAVSKNCGTCHGATPVGGAPMALVTYEDFQADHVVKLYKPLIGQTKKVYELAKIRINDHMSPMPPGGQIAPADFTTLDTWLGQGAPAATEATACAPGDDNQNQGGPVPCNGIEGTKQDGCYGELIPTAEETCYDLKVHGSQMNGDDTKYTVTPGEQYIQFYYDVPWATGALGSRYGTKFDNQAVLHHWLLFTTNASDADGSWVDSTAAPTFLLEGGGAQLLAGWAVGGTNLTLPDDAGFELPASGTKVTAQWHFYNTTDMGQDDSSSVQVCTVPAGSRSHVVSITWTGTEDLMGNAWTGGSGMPPHQMSTFSGTCDPAREGMDATEPIHIVGFWPHMHKLGTQMDFTVNHASGGSEMVFSKPFDFNYQVHYNQNYDLMPGDTLTTKCYFNNTTDMGVVFGESSDQEMCYGFVMSWPAHALENTAVTSWIGASNTCLQ